jgi:hypothetical protein
MKHNLRTRIPLVIVGCILIVRLLSPAQYQLVNGNINNGSALLSGASYNMVVTLGQPVIGSTVGFWPSDVKRKRVDIIPTEFEMNQNYPNPFNPTTNIEFSLPHASDVSVKVYNTLGEEVANLVSEHLAPGTYKTVWNARQTNGGQASGCASGVYFYRIVAGSFVETKKLLLIR